MAFTQAAIFSMWSARPCGFAQPPKNAQEGEEFAERYLRELAREHEEFVHRVDARIAKERDELLQAEDDARMSELRLSLLRNFMRTPGASLEAFEDLWPELLEAHRRDVALGRTEDQAPLTSVERVQESLRSSPLYQRRYG